MRIGSGAYPREHQGVVHDTDDRVIDARQDLAVVEQEDVCDPAETPERLVVTHGDWLVAQIAARHNERATHGIEEEMMERCVGEHHAHPVEAGRHRPGDVVLAVLRQQYNRMLGRDQQSRFNRRHRGDEAHLLDGTDHDGQRLGVPVLALAKAPDSGVARCIAREVESADAADGDYPPRGQQTRGLANRCVAVFEWRPVASGKPHARATLVARDRLRVVASVRRGLVFGAACLAHGENGHRRALAVVGERIDDRVARAAIGTGDERVAISPPIRVAKLGLALRTDRDVRGNRPVAVGVGALRDAELVTA
jgi:hypothetical protein